MATLLLAMLFLGQDATKDDVLRMTKEGRAEEEILAKIGKARFSLSVDEIVELKKAGVGEKVLARMVSGPLDLTVINRAHKSVWIEVREGQVRVGAGREVKPGETAHFSGGKDLPVWVNGQERNVKVTSPSTLTFRGANLEKFEVITLYVDGEKGQSDTCLVELVVREERAPDPRASGPPPGTRRVLRGGILERLWDWSPGW